MFASTDKLLQKKTTRRDDLISLAYILLYLFCDRTLPFSDEFFSEDQSESAKEYLKENLKFKKKYPIQKMAETGKCFVYIGNSNSKK